MRVHISLISYFFPTTTAPPSRRLLMNVRENEIQFGAENRIVTGIEYPLQIRIVSEDKSRKPVQTALSEHHSIKLLCCIRSKYHYNVHQSIKHAEVLDILCPLMP